MSEARIAAYLRGELTASERTEVEAAMDAEPHWLGVLALLAAEQDVEPSASRPVDGSTVERIDQQFSSRLHPGQQVGRFEIERPLGRGGMGSVYAAHDPKLRRTVALKILHASRPEEQPRLVAEARALAQVNHPNVITVHDVGRWNERVFVAMELLDGETLRAWRAAKRRRWQDVVSVYADAGRGLAAAHAAGIIHRDVKPSNIMLTTAGRVVVVDFGLAIELVQSEETPDGGDASHRGTGRAGTPAYMAPEQRRGETATAASDQFGLCVALYESLTGALPEASATPLRSAGFEGCGRVPRRLMRVVQRGLATRPEGRFESLDAFLDALRTAVNTPLWPVGVGVAGALSALVLWPGADEAKSCSGAQDELAKVWTPERRDALDGALRSPGAEWSDAVAEAVLERLDGYTEAWIVVHEQACAAPDDDVRLGARMLCLDRRLRNLDALLTVLERGGPETVSNATRAVDALPAVESCGYVASLADADQVRDPEIEALRDRLAYAEALREAASLDEAERVAREALGAIVPRHDKSLEADARLVLGWVEHERGRFEIAEEELRIAVALGTVARNDRAVAVGLDRLAWVVGYRLGRFADGRALADRAEAWSDRLEGGDTLASYREVTRGSIENDAGRPDLGLQHFERAMAIAREASPADPEAAYDLGLALNGAGSSYLGLGQLDASLDAFDQSSKFLAARLGPQHPRVAQVQSNRGSLLRVMGRPDEAREVFERTLEVFLSAYGEDHMTVGQISANLAVVHNDLGRYDEGLVYAERSVRVLRKVAGEDHPLVAKAYNLRGDSRLGLGEFEDGIRDLHRALAMEIELLGPNHPSVGIAQSNLSIAYDKVGRLEEAVMHQEQALEVLIAGYGETHDLVATGRMNLAFLERRRGNHERSLALYLQALEYASELSKGIILLGAGESYLILGRPDDAAKMFEEAVAFLDGKPPALGSHGEALYLLGQTRWEQGRRADARTLAEQAVAALGAEDDPELRAEVEAWLRSPRPFSFDAKG